MIRLLIVDDEDETREGLKDFIPWRELGVDTVNVASDGREALTLAVDIKPDIVITDIRMYGMDGITFASELRNLIPMCKIIFISGYSDKENLKSAIQLKAVSFIEKPINIDEVKQAVCDAVNMHIEEERIKALKENSDMIMRQTSYLIKQEIALDLISSHVNPESISKKLSIANIDFSNSNKYCSIIIKLQTFDISSESKPIMEHFIEIIDKAVRSIFRNYLIANKGNTCFIVHLCDDRIGETGLFKSLIRNMMGDIRTNPYGLTKIFMGVGKCVIGMENIMKSYQYADIAARQLFFTGYGQIVFYEANADEPYCFDNNMLAIFKNYLIGNNGDPAIAFIRSISFNFKPHRNASIDSIKNIFFNLALQLYSVECERGIENKSITQDERNMMWKQISEKETLDEIEIYLIERINAFYNSVEEMSTNNNPVSKAVHYIHENYSKNLSIEIIADKVHLTPAYLCQIFRKHMGNSINRYITKYRLEKSKEFLKDKQVKLTEVANKVGYSDANYFTRLFKKNNKITPSEYRDKYYL